MLWIYRSQFDHAGNANWRVVFVTANDGLSHLAVRAIRQLLDRVELAVFHRRVDQLASNSPEGFLVFAYRCELEPERIAKRLLSLAT
jgi:hypothetical protein